VSSFTSQIYRVNFSAGEHDIYVVLNKSFLTFIGMICDPMVIISFQKRDSSADGIIEDLQPTGFTVFPFFFIKALRLFTAVSMRMYQPQVAQSWLLIGVLIGREDCWINSRAFRKNSKLSLQ